MLDLAAADEVTEDATEDVRRARRVVPHRAGRMVERQRGGVGGVVGGAGTEQHVEAVWTSSPST